MPKKILVVDDEENIIQFLESILKKDGFDVISASGGNEALIRVKKDSPDMLLLDVMLPDMDGFEVCKRLRVFSEIPVIILTARDEDMDKIIGLEMGADDYVVKPFNPKELVARMNAIFRRFEASRRFESREIQVMNLTMDIFRRKAKKGDQIIDFAPKEFDLLLVLACNPDKVFTREELLREVWGYEFVDNRSVDVHIKYIREKLGKPLSECIQTVWGKGYKFVDVSRAKEVPN